MAEEEKGERTDYRESFTSIPVSSAYSSPWLKPEEETKARCHASLNPTSTLLETPFSLIFRGVGPRVPLRHHLQTRLQSGRVGCGLLSCLRTLQAPLLSVLREGSFPRVSRVFDARGSAPHNSGLQLTVLGAPAGGRGP